MARSPEKSKEPWTQRSGVPFSRTPEPTGCHRCMKTAPAETSIRELRANLADVINVAGTRYRVTFVTSRGRRGLRGHRRAGREPERVRM